MNYSKKNSTFHKFFSAAVLLVFFASCKEDTSLYILKYEETGFRKSYDAQQYMTKEELGKTPGANPVNDNVEDSLLYGALKKKGFVNENDELLISSFTFEKSPSFSLADAKGDTVHCVIQLQQKENWRYIISASSKKGTYEMPLAEEEMAFDKINYFLADIFPGGFKEIVVLRNHSVMNGDNYDLLVFEIKND